MKTSTGENKTARVLLAIPVYNEENYLDSVLDEVAKHLNDVLVIDDGSTDQSKIILARRKDVCVVSHKKNCGYGQSIIHAFNFAQGCGFDWIITMDCDLQHEPSRIPDFLAAITADDADIISGSRYLAQSQQQDQPPMDRRRINKLITESINQKLKLNLTDAFCGFKACRLSAIEKLSLTELGYAMPLEFWVEAARYELRVREIPIRLIYNDPTRHFGGDLDNEKTRLEHYRQVFERSLARAGLV